MASAIELSEQGSYTQKHNPVLSQTNVVTLNERRRAALAEIDSASLSWFHVRICLVVGVGFFTDAYDMFAISIVTSMLGYVYTSNGNLSSWLSTGVKIATPVGNLFGQLIFGWLADRFGRRRMYGLELVIMIIATFGQTLSGSAPAVNIFGALIVWRFILGIGIGGDYPLSAIIASEFAATRTRGRFMTAVFAFQGWGQLASFIVGIIIVTAYKDAILRGPSPCAPCDPVDYTWRILIGLGCVPAVIALYFRLTIPETPRFTMDIERNINQATQDVGNALTMGRYIKDEDAVVSERAMAPKANPTDFISHFSKWRNGKVLLGTAYSWFALDIAYYGLSLNSAAILTAIHYKGASYNLDPLSVYTTLHNVCAGNIVLSIAGSIPGYWVSFLVIDKWGRKPIQFMGFSILFILFVIIGFDYDNLVITKSGTISDTKSFVVLYCIINFFLNFGPNTTTFVVPGEAFPTRYRSTAHGLSAASGKLGAVVAQLIFASISQRRIKVVLEVFAFFMLTGVFSTFLIPETNQRTLEDISNEDQMTYITGAITAQA